MMQDIIIFIAGFVAGGLSMCGAYYHEINRTRKARADYVAMIDRMKAAQNGVPFQ